MTPATTKMEVREAQENDVEAIARLAGELGYPTTAAQVFERLQAVQGDPAHALFVAADPTGSVVGWIGLAEERSVLTDRRAEITGLIVDSRHRSAGVGRLLLERGERWARERGLAAMGVRSNVLRERTHEFYHRLGYDVIKSQKVFRKVL